MIKNFRCTKKSFAGKIIGVQTEHTSKLLKSGLIGKVNVWTYKTQDEVNLDLASGRIDAVLAAAVAFEDYNAKAGSKLKLVGPTFSGGTREWSWSWN